MPKVAIVGTLASNVGQAVKRKTPSELRGEQLKRNIVVDSLDDSKVPMLGSTCNYNEVGSEFKKTELSRNPRYIDIRMDEVFPAKKTRFRVLPGKENAKEINSMKQPTSLKTLTIQSNRATKRREEDSCPGISLFSDESTRDGAAQTRQTIGKCSQSTFRSVTELSSGGERPSGIATVDLDKALKGLVAREAVSDSPAAPSSIHSGSFLSEFHFPGQKVPLDFTLKTCVRVVSSLSANLIHRSIMASGCYGLPQFSSSGCSENSSCSGSLTNQIFSSKALHSWVYPQSILPPSLICALTSSVADGVEMDFLSKRQVAWEDSFRNLYFMLRKNVCNIFYVCTSHFVVMFMCSNGMGTSKYSCNAYISQSTRGLRSLLREHDVCFSMPLCRSKVEQATTEDLVELSEIEKQNLGQTRRLASLSDIDNTPQSLLAFDNKNVHALYDFLLNYRSYLTYLTAVDVPMLYSPVPFQNAVLSAPEVSCLEIKKPDNIAASGKGSWLKDDIRRASTPGFTCSIELKDAYIPPWIICNVCSLIGSEGGIFEASFTTERTSVGLNAAIMAVSENSDAQAKASEGMGHSQPPFGISEAIISPYLQSGYLKGLARGNSSYKVILSPV